MLRRMKPTALLLAVALAWPAGLCAGEITRTERFAFHSDLWMNLHHFLYAWATQEKSPTVPRPHRRPMPDKAHPPALAPDEQALWDRAVAFYREKLGDHSLVFSLELRDLKRRHWNPAYLPATPPHPLLNEIERTIATVRPVYEKHWWPEHDRANRAWLATIAPTVARWENRMVADLARIYGGAWPAGVIRVDVTAYTDYYGAYNTGEPHVTIASKMDKNAHPHGVEIVFHEASHSALLEDPLNASVAAAAKATGKKAPRDLWHMLIFHTTGELSRRAFAAEGRADYAPYAEREGLYRPTSDWGRAKPLLDEHWRPALAQSPEDRAAALRKIITCLAELAAADQKPAPTPKPE
jgi:hypothetical protein